MANQTRKSMGELSIHGIPRGGQIGRLGALIPKADPSTLPKTPPCLLIYFLSLLLSYYSETYVDVDTDSIRTAFFGFLFESAK